MSKQPERVFPISKVPVLESQPDSEFRLYAAEREVSYLRAEIQRLKAAVRFKDERLRDQRDLWRLGLDYGEWPTMGQVLRNLDKLESAIEYTGPLSVEDQPVRRQRR